MNRDRPSLAGLAAAALSGAVAVYYLVLIAQGAVGVQGDEVRVAIVATVLLALPVCAAAGALRPASNIGVALLAIAAAGLLAMGFLAMFSIGSPLLVASTLAWVAVFRARRSGHDGRGAGRSGGDPLV